MANNPSTLPGYNGQTAAPDANYTYGSARDDAAPGDLTGTPRIAAEVNDIMGFQQALLNEASIIPSGSPDTAATSQYLQALRKIISELASGAFPTLAGAVASTDTGKITEGATLTIGDRANGMFRVVTLASLGGGPLNGFDEVELVGIPTLALKLIIVPTLNDAEQYGVVGDDDGTGQIGSTDNTDALQRAIIAPGPGSYTVLDGSKAYKIDDGIYIPQRSTLDMNNGRLAYTGTGTGTGQATSWAAGVPTGPVAAVTLGEETGGLQYQARFLNFKLNLISKLSTGVVFYGSSESQAVGRIEGVSQPFDNTRTNIGTLNRGSAVASNFSNTITVECNHIHECHRVENYGVGNTQVTGNTYFVGGTNGDQSTDDTSIAFNFADSTVAGQGQGTKILGTNIEKCNIGIYFGANNEGIDVNARFEIGTTATSRLLKYNTVTPPTDISVRGSAIDAAIIGAVPKGIEGFGGGSNRIYDSKGSVREGGNDSSFAGFSAPIHATNVTEHFFKEDSNTNWRTRDDAAGTGRFQFQPGEGSAAFGAAIQLHGHAHGSEAGIAAISNSAGVGSVDFNNGLNGPTMGRIDPSQAAGETALWIFDADNATLERVTVGTANSGGAGFKVLRIPN